jgi:hypothetical protein
LRYDIAWIVRKGFEKLRRLLVKNVDTEDIHLVHCPWCGDTPVIVKNEVEYRVECGNPNCPVVTRTHWKLDMMDVIKDWNTRA